MIESQPRYPRDVLNDWYQTLPSSPTRESQRLLGDLVDVLFFASMDKEEGQPARIRIVYHPEGMVGIKNARGVVSIGGGYAHFPSWQVIPLERMELTSKALVKISPAAHRARAVVVVGPHQGKLYIEGLARRSNYGDYGTGTVILSAPEPGTIVLFQEGTDLFSEGKELFLYERGFRVLDHHSLWHAFRNPGLIKSTIENLCASLINAFPGDVLLGDPKHTIQWTLHHMIETMVSARHGGLIAILPNEDTEFKKGPVYLVPHEHRNLFRDGLSTFMGAQRDFQKLSWDSVWRDPSKTMTEDE